MAMLLLRDAEPRVLEEEVALVDQLFALECAARSRQRTAATARKLNQAKERAIWRSNHDWEPDVPHAAEVGQLIACCQELRDDVPSSLINRLNEALDVIFRRKGGRGLGSDASLLASVIRGIAVADLPLPKQLVDLVARTFERHLDCDARADLTEAAVRHSVLYDVAESSATVLFTMTSGEAGSFGVARSWLFHRWEKIIGNPLSIDPSGVEQARFESLTSPLGRNPRLAAMAMEVAAADAGTLVIERAATLVARESRRERWRILEISVWRTVFALILCWAGLSSLHAWGTKAYHLVHRGAVPSGLYQAVAGSIFTVGAVCVYLFVRRMMRLYLHMPQQDTWGTADFAFAILIPGTGLIFGLLVYPR
jgi:hypothetical protein